VKSCGKTRLSSNEIVERYKARKRLQAGSVYYLSPCYDRSELRYKPPQTVSMIGARSKHQTLLLMRRACQLCHRSRIDALPN
jgi:hypothetical protein